MKFGQTLATRLTPEWRKQYISYSILKDMILKAVSNAPGTVGSEEFTTFVTVFDEDFFAECNEELIKIDTFFAEKSAEAKRKFREYNNELEFLAENHLRRKKAKIDLSTKLSKRKAKMLKLALSEYYLSLILLRNYQTLNLTGFRKILKKHDKRLNTTSGAEFFSSLVEKVNVFQNNDIENLISETETIFTNYLAHGDRSRAMKELRVQPFEEKQSVWGTFRLGFGCGAFVCLFLLICLSVAISLLPPPELENCMQLHSASFILIIFLFLIGLDICGWRNSGVNHILIFEIDPRHHLTGFKLMEVASYFGILWALSFLTCLHRFPSWIPPNISAVLLVFIMLIFWINPIHILLWSSRLWLMKITARIICAPFFRVSFADFWVADQFCSLTMVFIELQFIPCSFITKNWLSTLRAFSCIEGVEYYTNTILYSLPNWWRMLQSLRRYRDTKLTFPFLVNVAKYATSIVVAGAALVNAKTRAKYKRKYESPFFWMYILSRISNSSFAYAWDILMDFGLFRKFSGENIFLRNEIIYAPSFYYFAIVEDLILRFFWVVVMLMEDYQLMTHAHMATLMGIAEIVRRYIWNLIRLENEHLNNVGQFRAVRDISVTLVAPEGEKSLVDMMDGKKGVASSSSTRASILD